VRRVGEHVHVPRALTFPAVCVKCGTHEALRARRQNYTWVPPWTYLLLFVGVVPCAILQSIMMKRFAMVFPVCGPCDQRWKTARIWWPLSMLVPFFGGLGAAFLFGYADVGALVGLSLTIMFLGPFVAATLVHFLLVRRNTVTIAHADDFTVRLRGVAEPMKQALECQWAPRPWGP
jgi:hypothetical protein